MVSFVPRWLGILATLGLAAFATPFAQAQERVTYFHTDLQGSSVAASDANGNRVWAERYEPYGERTNFPPSAGTNPVWYAGSSLDVDTGLQYMGARHYDPVVGRFYGVDPVAVSELEPVDSFSRYSYARNNPYLYSDGDGRDPERAFGISVGFFMSRDASSTLAAAESEFGNADVAAGIAAGQAISDATQAIRNGVPIGAVAVTAGTAVLANLSAKKTGPRKWKPGDSPHAQTQNGTLPSDRTITRREWKNEAQNPARTDYTAADFERMKKGLPPQRYNPAKGGIESMERSHEPIPKRDGGTQTKPRWPQEHAAIDPHRKVNY